MEGAPTAAAIEASSGRERALLLRNHLESLVTRQLHPHDKMPSERILAEHFGVTRTTVRHALNQLEHDGLIYRQHGSGTFVAEPRIIKALDLTSFSIDMASRGLTPGSKVLETAVVEASSAVAFALAVPPGAAVVHLTRLRTADARPMCLEDLYLPAELVPDLLEQDLSQSLYALLENRYGVTIDRARQVIEVTTLTRAMAGLLNAAPHSPAIRVTRYVQDISGRLVEFAVSVYRGDRYNYDFTVHRTPGVNF